MQRELQETQLCFTNSWAAQIWEEENAKVTTKTLTENNAIFMPFAIVANMPISSWKPKGVLLVCYMERFTLKAI